MLLVTVTSKTTGRYAIAYCENELKAEEFIDAMSGKIDENGHVWWTITEVARIKTYKGEE